MLPQALRRTAIPTRTEPIAFSFKSLNINTFHNILSPPSFALQATAAAETAVQTNNCARAKVAQTEQNTKKKELNLQNAHIVENKCLSRRYLLQDYIWRLKNNAYLSTRNWKQSILKDNETRLCDNRRHVERENHVSLTDGARV